MTWDQINLLKEADQARILASLCQEKEEADKEDEKE